MWPRTAGFVDGARLAAVTGASLEQMHKVRAMAGVGAAPVASPRGNRAMAAVLRARVAYSQAWVYTYTYQISLGPCTVPVNPSCHTEFQHGA
jgi:hypothetical protein